MDYRKQLILESECGFGDPSSLDTMLASSAATICLNQKFIGTSSMMKRAASAAFSEIENWIESLVVGLESPQAKVCGEMIAALSGGCLMFRKVLPLNELAEADAEDLIRILVGHCKASWMRPWAGNERKLQPARNELRALPHSQLPPVTRQFELFDGSS